MSGWHTQIVEATPVKGVVGIVVAQKFPDPEIIRVKIEEGLERVAPDTVWVMRDGERKNHAVNFAWQTFRSHGIEPFLAPLVPAWKSKGLDLAFDVETRKASVTVGDYDLRSSWRDIEMRSTTERIIVFHDVSSGITADWLDYRENGMSRAKIYVIERGKTRVKRYKTGRALS